LSAVVLPLEFELFGVAKGLFGLEKLTYEGV
jgi:hypothetical protein